MEQKEIKKRIIEKIKKSSPIYKIDKYFKIMRVKLITYELVKDTVYNVNYEYGIYLLNPFSWIFVLIPSIFIGIYEDGVKEVISDLGDMGKINVTDVINIKE